MKAILEFDLPDEKDDFTLAMKGIDLYSALFDLNGYLRDQLKYEDLNDSEATVTEQLRDKLFEIMEEYNINLGMVS